jgi:type I restriction enzyme S subunit
MAKLSPINHNDKKAAIEFFGFPEIWEVEYSQFAFNEVRDGTHDSPKESPEGVPLVTSKNLKNGAIDFSNTKIISYEDHEEISKRSGVAEGDLLFSMIGTIGNVAQVGDDVNFSVKNVGLFRRNDSLLAPRFAYHWLTSYPYLKYLDALKRGGNQKFVSLGVLRESPVPLPPLAEQKVIAEKLDKLLAKVDSIKTRLDAVPDTLKRFRQSVLAAAVSGKLTEGALKREIEYMALGDAGVEVKTGPFGSALHKSEYVSGGIPVINPMHISAGRIQPSDSMTVTETKFKELEAWHLKKGDVVVGRRGEMGRAAVVDATDEILCGTGSMILRTPENSLPKYLEIVIRSPIAVAYFTSNSVGSTMVNLNQKIIKSLQVYFPPFEEQTEIVRRVENLFAYADKVEAEVNAAQERVNKLTQSILAKAFRGELTAKWREQNPELISGDNSAEALLEKIKAEREKLTPKKKARARKKA